MDFRYKRKYTAGNGMDGQGKRCSGKDGEDLIIRVPRGTVVRDAESQEIICDMSQCTRFVLARGATIYLIPSNQRLFVNLRESIP